MCAQQGAILSGTLHCRLPCLTFSLTLAWVQVHLAPSCFAGTHPALLELLEVPQLMDACVRNGSYDDALDLRAFVRKLAVMHGDLGMAQRLLGEATTVADTMLRQLLARLRTNIQLPECLRVIGFLRRLEAFPEQVGGFVLPPRHCISLRSLPLCGRPLCCTTRPWTLMG